MLHYRNYIFFTFFILPTPVFGISLPELLGLGKNKPPKSEKSVRSIRARSRKKKKPYQTIKTMNYEQLADYRQQLLANAAHQSPIVGKNPRLISRRRVCKEKQDNRTQVANKTRAIKYTEAMIPLCKDLQECGQLMLELADLNFDCGNLEIAQKKYKEFTTLYPGDENLYRALHRELLCSFYLSLDAERDQGKTDEALKVADRFLQRTTPDNKYYQEVLNIKEQCKQRLFDHELSVTQFYLKRGSYTSAYTRIKNTKNAYQEFIAQSSKATQQLAQLEQELITSVPSLEALLKNPEQKPVVAHVTETTVVPSEKVVE